MSAPIVLCVAGVGKRYASYRSLLERFATWFGAGITPSSEYWAVQDVSFELRAGEALAIIGQNGAGKSTMLKLITGTVQPTTGAIGVTGRASAIIELGLGFNSELTGRENVRQAGGLIGHSAADIEQLMPAIEAFAEIGAFMDQPLRVYSSGMQARLAFSLVTAARPDLLFVDEVLAVGDSYFQHKSAARIREFKEAGTAIVLVTHGMADVRALCDRAILLDRGKVLKNGLPDEVVDYYNALIAAKENETLTIEQRRQANGWLHTKSGTGEAVAKRVDLLDGETGTPVISATVGQPLRLVVEAHASHRIEQLILGIMIRDRTGHVVWGTNTWHTEQPARDVAAGERVVFEWRFRCNLGQGSYGLSYALAAAAAHTAGNFEWVDNAVVFDVFNQNRPFFAGTSVLDADFSMTRHI